MSATQSDHVHDCCAPGGRCGCGYVFTVPPISFEVDVFNRNECLAAEAFNCEDLRPVIARLRELADELERHGKGLS